MTEMIDISCSFCPASWREKPLKPPDHTPTTILKNDGFSGAVVRRTAGDNEQEIEERMG